MYRIHFDPNVGRFIIQVVYLGIFWNDVRELDENLELAPIRFITFDEAQRYVERIGLNQLYEDRSSNMYRAYMTR